MMTFDATKVQSLTPKPYFGQAARETVRRLASSSGLIVEGGLLDLFKRQGFDLVAERDNKSVYDPQKQFDGLARYVGGNDWHIDERAFSLACSVTMKAFGSHGLKLDPLLSFDDLLSTIDGSKSSGAPLFSSKGEVYSRDYDLMLRIRDGSRVPPPCVAFHRVQHGLQGPKQRLVWGYPQSMTLLEAQFARPLINHFLKKRSPMAFGLHRHQVGSRLVRIENRSCRVTMDYSGFDSSVNPRLIDFAFGVLKTYFNEEHRGVMDKLINYFIHTPILMPDGLVYRKHRGIPSGSYFTQLVGSIINYLSIQYAFIRLLGGPALPDQILVLGDDSVFGTDGRVSLGHLAQVVGELGLKMSEAKSGVTRFGEPLHFLGHYWQKQVVDRPMDETVKRMVFPERWDVNLSPKERAAIRVLAYLSDSVSAWRLLRLWDRYHGPKVRPHILRFSVVPPVTGHSRLMAREFLTRGVVGSDVNGYLGVLL